MKRILPAFVFALIIHGALFTMDVSWLACRDRVAPRTQGMTMSLVERKSTPQPVIRPLPPPPSTLLAEPKPAPQKPAVRKTAAKSKTAPRKKPKTSTPQLKPSPKPIFSPPVEPLSAVAQPPESVPAPEPISKSPLEPAAPQRIETNPTPAPETTASLPPSEESPDAAAASDALASVVMATPRYNENPPPVYPAIARKRNCQGTVILEVFVKEDGRVGDLRVVESSNYSLLDRAAAKAVRRWLFEPARRGDRKVSMWVNVPVRFRLE